jgi:cysteine desulfurase
MEVSKYFDYAATGIPDKEILEKALAMSLEYSGNPSSVHKEGIKAKNLIDEMRNRCAKVLGVKAENLYFTSGGTESDHIPFLALLNRPNKGSVVISNIEHPAVREIAESLKKTGWKVIEAPCNQMGIVEPETVVSKLQDDTALVSIMTVNNETGAIQPIYEIAQAIENHCKGKRKPKFHTDAVQAIGKIPVDLAFKGIDSAAISAHKFSGPRGVGILYSNYQMESFLKGGGQEKGLRSGTENLFGIIAMTLCLEKCASKSVLEENLKSEKENVDFFISEILKDKNATLIPECRSENPENYSPSVVQIAFNNIPGEVMVRTLSSKGYCISTGSACSARKMNRPILKAMGISDEKATNAVRFSFGAYTEKSHMENLIKELTEISSMFNR